MSGSFTKLAFAALQGDSQLAVEMLELANLGANVIQFSLQTVTYRCAGPALIFAQGQQLAYLGQRKPKPLRSPDEQHGLEVLVRIEPKATLGAPRVSQDFIPFVEANCIHAETRSFRDSPDKHRCHSREAAGYTLDYSLESRTF